MFEAPSTRILRRASVILLLFAAMAVVGLHLARGDRADRLERLERTEARLGGEVLRLKRQNRQLSDELDLIEHSPLGWQEAARREQGLIMPDELVVRFPVE
jgi:cell division protein FtsB